MPRHQEAFPRISVWALFGVKKKKYKSRITEMQSYAVPVKCPIVPESCYNQWCTPNTASRKQSHITKGQTI